MKALLKRFGYIKESDLTEQYLAELFAQRIGNPIEYNIEKDQDANFFKDLAKVEGVREYLKATAAKDLMRYFSASDEKEQAVIRGGFARVTYFLSRLKKG